MKKIKKIAICGITSCLALTLLFTTTIGASAQEVKTSSISILQNELEESKQETTETSSNSITSEGASSISNSLLFAVSSDISAGTAQSTSDTSGSVENETEASTSILEESSSASITESASSISEEITLTTKTPQQEISAFSSISESGIWGNVSWELDDEGTLTFTTSGTFADSNGSFGSYNPYTANWYPYAAQIKKVVFTDEVQAAEDSTGLFYNCENLTSIEGLDKLDTSSVTTMFSMFRNCSSLTELNLGDKFDTRQVA